MPRGQPDFGLYTDTPVASGISDPGEAAARLGSINIYDRRGWTVWMDDFEAPVLRWGIEALGGGVNPVFDTTRSVSGIQCVKLACAAAAAPHSHIRRSFPLIRLGRVGVEFWVQMKSVDDSHLNCEVQLVDGVNLTAFTLKYYPFTNEVYIEDPGGDVPIAEDVYMSIDQKYFLPLKLVADMDSDYYTRLLVGEREFDISQYQRWTLVPSDNRFVQVTIRLDGVPATDTYAYIDDFILTQNEP